MIGVIVGTYSSLFVVSPIMLDTIKRKKQLNQNNFLKYNIKSSLNKGGFFFFFMLLFIGGFGVNICYSFCSHGSRDKIPETAKGLGKNDERGKECFLTR